MSKYELSVGTLLIQLLIAHIAIFVITVVWFRKDLAEWTKKQPITYVTLFILGNFWPLTWIAYLVYATCSYFGAVVQQQRLLDLIDENANLEGQIERLKDQLAEIRDEELCHRSREETKELLKTAAEVSAGFNSLKSPTSLPPYTPDVWKAIKELRNRVRAVETYLGKWDRSGTWIDYLEQREAEEKAP